MLSYHDGDVKCEPSRRNSISLFRKQNQQKTKLEPLQRMLTSVFAVSKKQEEYLTFGKE